MKGIILSEFVEFLEQHAGEDAAQQIIDQCQLASDGAYSRVGLYDYHELIQLLTESVSETGASAEEMLDGFSNHLFAVFKRDYGVFFEGIGNAAQMLMQIDNHIHVEVEKLYPDAELPRFDYRQDGANLILNYQSPRPLALVAKALVSACLKYFGDQEVLTAYTLSEDLKSAEFVIQMAAAS
ncbi:heme NO-binding domain-containing protein [Arenicella xantha]|uniref:Heme-NO-binding protein n=1 Tax=Arenicella xantha TaxID=644221 RepID=A0A395JLX2_9GAMM|nr:heme NO-binding domain-containing protein [Arenicella xantha]RBP51425.1 heme-NO-binding protein [Arenicella xantha]